MSTEYQKAEAKLSDLAPVIEHMESTPEEAWRTDTVRSADGTTNCFFGHLFGMGANDSEGNALWNMFEEMWFTTYVVYPVNDGTHPDYQQATPKQRVLAYLRDLQSGKALTTYQSMEACYQTGLEATR